MIAYPIAELELLEKRELVDEAAGQGLISEKEQILLRTQFPLQLYMPQIFVRIGLGVLASVVLQAFTALFMQILGYQNDAIIALLTGFLSLVALEWFIRQKNHYRSGIDDVLLQGATGAFLLFIANRLDLDHTGQQVLMAALAMAVYTLAWIRYLDRLALLLSLAAWAALVVTMVMYVVSNPLPEWYSWVLAPIMATSMWVSWRMAGFPGMRWHRACLQLFSIMAGVLCYLSLHVYVIDNLLQLLPAGAVEQASSGGGIPFDGGGEGQPGMAATATSLNNLPLASRLLYWGWTVGVPPLMIWLALRRRNRMQLRIWILLFLSIFYFQHYYYPVLPGEITTLLYGVLLLAIWWWLVTYLKKQQGSFSFRKGGDEGDLLQSAPWLVVAGFAGTGGEAPRQSGTQFGGGNFGGGGAGAEY